MRAADLNPDAALKALLEGQITTDQGVVDVYEHASMPNDITADSYISLRRNGIVDTVTERGGAYRGNLALRIYCRLYTDNTANVILTRLLARLCEDLVDRKVSGDYFFKLNAANPITDIYVNTTSGYSEYALNVTWRTPTAKL